MNASKVFCDQHTKNPYKYYVTDLLTLTPLKRRYSSRRALTSVRDQTDHAITANCYENSLGCEGQAFDIECPFTPTRWARLCISVQVFSDSREILL
jgi:hypothetical protein